MTSTTVLQSESVLGKRNRSSSFVLRLASSPDPQYNTSHSDFDDLPDKTRSNPFILVNGALVANTKKRYQCTYAGCDKSYSKPSRLEEHQRSHTGQRPYVCETCNKAFLRETHLHAHSRKHLPESSRPLVCPKDNCEKRFWTQQHLRVHINWHEGAKTFQCTEDGCDEAFAKHHQLRSHICSAHAPGTKPYRCAHEGCTRSFDTNQHLRTHSKVHDEKRYTCVHASCLPNSDNTPTYYPTWTALQHHIRTVHPPTCTHASCNGRVFASQKGLRAHQKLHEQRDLEEEMAASDTEEADSLQPPRKKRRGGEIGRDWQCDVDGCLKDFKSKKALNTHTQVTHLGRRDHICPHDGCEQTYGYKHLLQRHLAKAHHTTSDDDSPHDDDPDESDWGSGHKTSRKMTSTLLDIDTITGRSYAQRARANVANAIALFCPYPQLEGRMLAEKDAGEYGPQTSATRPCEYAFSRAYDLRRHLRATHGVNAIKESVDEWVSEQKRMRRLSIDSRSAPAPTSVMPPS
ncbi:hypothetical protein H2248_004912 [Termitomyces sp. 'cryptogamus']|nr:hypothetical protein H2248_004912 [Termitomyces sp. 'cryptogamus']